MLLVSTFVCIEGLYLVRSEFNPDESQSAHLIHTLRTDLPYRDFKPYKTVLGYYLQLPALLLTDDSWRGYLLLRAQLTAINALAMLLAAFMLARHFRREAVCFALLMLVTMSTFVERAFEIRVDMLTAWCGVFSLLLLLDRRFFFAGVVCALSFFVSQKGAYYIVSSNVALAAWLMFKRDRAALLGALSFNGAMLAILFAYLAGWSMFSPSESVVGTTFKAYRIISFGEVYEYLGQYWRQTLWRNPFFYAVAAVHLLQCVYWHIQGLIQDHESLLAPYAFALCALCLWHNQPWPYFFLLLIPTLFVVHASFFHRLIPVLGGGQQFVLLLFLAMALIPLIGRFDVTFNRYNDHQRHVLEVAESFLEPGDGYVDGVDLLYRQRQAVKTLRWLDRRNLMRLGRQDESELLRIVAEAPIKLLIHNSRLARLPESLRAYFDENFASFNSNIRIYAPLVEPGPFSLRFAGRYRLAGRATDVAVIDGVPRAIGQSVTLAAGAHTSSGVGGLRMVYLPVGWEEHVDERFIEERPDFGDFKYTQ